MTGRTRGITFALLATAAGLVWWLGRSPRRTQAAQAPSPGTVVPTPPNAAAVVAPGTPTGQHAALPVWSTPDGKPFAKEEGIALKRSISNEVALPGGGKAVLRAVRPRVTAGMPVMLELKLTNANGTPLRGRTDTELLVLDEKPAMQGGKAPYRAGFAEEPDEPGVYKTAVTVDPSQKKVTLKVFVSESGNPNTPGRMASAAINLEANAPAAFAGRVVGYYDPRGLVLQVPVLAKSAATSVTVRTEVRRSDGRKIAEVTGSGEVGTDAKYVEVVVPGATPTNDRLLAVNLTLFAGSPPEWVDFEDSPRAITIGPGPLAAPPPAIDVPVPR